MPLLPLTYTCGYATNINFILNRSFIKSMTLRYSRFVTDDETSEQFVGNATAPDHFRILDKDDFSIIVGGR